MNQRINIICNYASEYGGNFIPSLFAFAEKAKHDNCVVFTFPIEAKDRYWALFLKQKGYQLFFIDSFNSKFKQFKRDVRKINKTYSIDTVYSHFISGLKMKMICKCNRKLKLIIHVHSDFTGNKKPNLKSRIKSFVEKHIRTKNTKYIYVSRALYDKDGVKTNSYFLPNALNLFRIPSNNDKSENCINEINKYSQKTIILAFAWSPFVKGIDVLTKAFLSLEKEKQSLARLVIIHGRNNGLQKCIDFLEERLHSKDFLSNPNIVFLNPIEDVFSLYQVADVFVSSSRSEGFSYSLLEAMYFGLKCISSDIEGVVWSKKYDICSYYEAEDFDSLKLLLSNSIGNKTNKIKRTCLLNDFNIEKWSDELLKITLN